MHVRFASAPLQDCYRNKPDCEFSGALIIVPAGGDELLFRVERRGGDPRSDDRDRDRDTDPCGVTAPDIWVVAWGASSENATTGPSNPGGAEQTFRSFLYPSLSGTTERVRFSNYFGTAPVTIGAARLAIAATPPAVDATHDLAL